MVGQKTFKLKCFLSSDRLVKFRKQSIQSSFRIEKLIKKHALEKI